MSDCGCSRSSITTSCFVADSSRPVPLRFRSATAASTRIGSTRPSPTCMPMLDYLRGRSEPGPARRHPRGRRDARAASRARVCNRFSAAPPSSLASPSPSSRRWPAPRRRDKAPVVLERQIHRRRRASGDRLAAAIAAICARFDDRAGGPPEDYVFDLHRPSGQQRSLASPGRRSSRAPRSSRASFPSSRSRSPGFALLAGLVLGHMRRTAATIASRRKPLASSRPARSALRSAKPDLLSANASKP